MDRGKCVILPKKAKEAEKMAPGILDVAEQNTLGREREHHSMALDSEV